MSQMLGLDLYHLSLYPGFLKSVYETSIHGTTIYFLLVIPKN